MHQASPKKAIPISQNLDKLNSKLESVRVIADGVLQHMTTPAHRKILSGIRKLMPFRDN